MADSTAATALEIQKWERKFFMEYIQNDVFTPLMGQNEGSVIQIKEIGGKGQGDNIVIPLVNKLSNAATTGTSVMEGNEEDLATRSHTITIDKRRNAVRVAEMSEQKSAIDLRNAGRATLLDWAKEDSRDLTINALGSLNGTNFVSRTATIANTWIVDNSDRVVFGAGVGSFTDMSADLALLDTTSDLFNFTALDAMILKAKTASPKIRPMRDLGDGRRYYVAFANPNAFKDLRDSLDANILAETVVKMQASKLFEGGDLFWNGCIIKELDDAPIYANIGDSGTTEVTPVYLCGAQAVGFALGRRWRTKTKSFDYGDKQGVEVSQIYGVSKMTFGTGTTDTDDLKDHGVVTGYFATTGAATVASAGEV
tara:strand:+ start:8117 stop:9220 length:1104 start_codon:yes stop_codon:yes gene_type:complete